MLKCYSISFQISDLKTGAEQKLIMWHYLAWPDFGLPKDSPTLYKLVNSLKKSKGTLVHCSAGVGRTGTFIALSNLIHLVETNAQYLNLFQTVLDLRKNRPHMVCTAEQSIFLRYYEVTPKGTTDKQSKNFVTKVDVTTFHCQNVINSHPKLLSSQDIWSN